MNAPRDIRLIAQWRDDPTEALMSVDLRIEGIALVARWDLFGAFDCDGSRSRPFILRRDGRIDFGAGAAPWRTDLRSAEIKIGETFLVWFNDADHGQYKIVKLAELGGKDRR
jgi:hypothetical protein